LMGHTQSVDKLVGSKFSGKKTTTYFWETIKVFNAYGMAGVKSAN